MANYSSGALDHGPVQAAYFYNHTVGPFIDAGAFNDAVQFWSLYWMPMEQRFPDPVGHLLPDDAAICFTHGDLHLDNIMISGEPGSRHVASVVDWGQAGWYPEFWEYVCMECFVWNHEWFEQGWSDRVLKRYPDESEALETYWSWHGPA
jgi:hypothetical protein